MFYRATNNENEHLIENPISTNHLTGCEEKGLSVYYTDIYMQKSTGAQEYNGKKYIGIVTGNIIGFGSDGEPVLTDVKWVQKPICRLPKKYSRENIEIKRELTKEETPWRKLSFSPFDNDVIVK